MERLVPKTQSLQCENLLFNCNFTLTNNAIVDTTNCLIYIQYRVRVPRGMGVEENRSAGVPKKPKLLK